MAINNPRDISGLVGWYSADNMTAHYTNGQSMDFWIDLSGANNHARSAGSTYPLYQSATGPSSGPAVRFGGAGYFTLPSGLFGSATAAEAMLKIKSDDTNQRGFWTIGSQGNGSHYPFSGLVYDNFGSSSQRINFNPSLSITSWRRYNVWSASNDWAASLDGVSQFSNATNTVGFHASPALGYSVQVGYYQLGHQSVVVFYNRQLNSTERSDLATWMDANPSGGTITTFDDAFANAPALPSIHKVTNVNTTGFTTEVLEPGTVFNTAWAKFTPTVTGIYVLDTIGSNYDTVLTVYTGTALNNLVSVGSDDDGGGSTTSKLTISLTAGTTYYIQVGAKALGGGTNLSFSLAQKPDSRLSAVAAEAALTGTAERRLAGIAAEMATGPATAPLRRLGSLVAEVAVPSRLGYRGWGVPSKGSSWTPVTSYSAVVLSDNPIAYYRLNDPNTPPYTMADSSGNGRDGTLSGVTPNQASLIASDTANKAMYFGDPTGGNVPYGTWMDVPTMTIEAWVNLTTFNWDRYIACRSANGFNTDYAWRLEQLNGSEAFRFTVRINGISYSVTTGSYAEGATHHVVGTYDGTTLKIYVDGSLISSLAQSGSISTNGNAFRIGSASNGDGNLAGVVDECAFYSGALTADRISAHYNAAQ